MTASRLVARRKTPESQQFIELLALLKASTTVDQERQLYNAMMLQRRDIGEWFDATVAWINREPVGDLNDLAYAFQKGFRQTPVTGDGHLDMVIWNLLQFCTAWMIALTQLNEKYSLVAVPVDA